MASQWEQVFASEIQDPNFCAKCGSLVALPEDAGDVVVCRVCKNVVQLAGLIVLLVTA